MTTANLQVGIDTSQAFESLKKLRVEMQNQPHKLLISVDPTSVDQDIQRYLKQRTFKISVNTRALGDEIANDIGAALDRVFAKNDRKLSWNVAALRGGMNSAVDEAFNDSSRRLRFDRNRLAEELEASVAGTLGIEHIVRINKEALTLSIREAVTAGLAGGAVHISGVAGSQGPSAATLGPDLVTTLQRTLLPAVDAMERAANAIASAARKAEITAPNGKLSAKQSISVTDPTTGYSTSVSKQLEAPEAVKVDVESARAQQQAVAMNMLQITEEYRAGYREIQQAVKLAMLQQTEEYRMGLKAQQQEIATGMLQQTEEYRAGYKAQLQETAMSLLQQTEEYKAGYRAQQQETAMSLLQQTEEYRAGYKAQRQEQALAMLQQTEEYRMGLKAQTDALVAFYAEQKFLASKNFSGIGPDVAATRATTKQFGVDKTADFLGPSKQYLLDGSIALEDYRTKLKGVTTDVTAARDAHKAFNSILTETHAGVRGLAGSMGAMWLTWGSLVPIIAGAAIGTALRDVLQVGTAVQENLTRVAAMSGTTGVSLMQFNSAIVGSMASSVEASVGLKDLAQSGLTSGDALRALPAVLALASAGQLDLKDTTHDLVGVMNAFGLGVSDLAHIGDVIGKTAATSNISTKEMLESMRAAGEVASEFKLKLTDTAGVLGVLAEKGVTGAGAASQLQKIMTTLSAPTGKAAGAMKELGINVIDSNKQVLPLLDALQVLKDKTQGLSEASRDLALKDMFSVRNTKPLEALLGNLDELQAKMKTAGSSADGFNQRINEAIGDQIQGKLKKLTTSFEIDATEAFQRAAGSAGGLVDQLRLLVDSPEFKQGLSAIISGVVSLTRYLADHAKAISEVAIAYASFKVLDSVITWLRAVPAAALVAKIAMLEFGAASAAALAYATAGISIVLSLAASYYLLKDHTSEAERALKDYSNALDLTNNETDKRISRLDAENGLLERQIELMNKGVPAAKAKAQAEAEGKKSDAETNGGSAISLATNLARQHTLQDQLSDYKNRSTSDSFSGGAAGALDAAQKAQHELDLLNVVISKQEDAVNKVKQELGKQAQNASDAALVKIKTDIEEFNRHLEEIKNINKGIKTQPIDVHITDKGTQADWQSALDKAKSSLSKEGGTYTSPKKNTEAEQRDRSEVQAEIESLNQAASMAKLQADLQKNVDDAQFPAGKDGAVNAYLAEQRAIQGTVVDIKLQVAAIEALTAAKTKLKNLTPSERSSIDRTISGFDFKRQEDELKLQNQQQVSGINSVNRRTTGDNTDSALRDKLNQEDQKQLQQIRQSYSKKVDDPSETAAITAAMAVESRYASDILKYTDKVKDDQAQISVEKARALTLTGDDATRQAGILTTLNQGLALDQTRLATLKAQATSATQIAASLGKSQYDASQTAAYGWKAFWDAYTTNAQSAAKQVEDLLKATTDGIDKAVEKLATTGKWNWRPIADGVLSTASKDLVQNGTSAVKGLFGTFGGAGGIAKTAATDAGATKLTTTTTLLDTSLSTLNTTGVTPLQASLLLLNEAANGAAQALASTAVSGGVTSGSNDVSAVGDAAAFVFAKGGIMTPYGPMSLHKYDSGGIAHGPQVSVYGEGALPEANVPLQDGRSIPVTLNGSASSGGNVTQLTYSPVIHIDSRSDQSQVAQLVGKAVQTGQKQMLQHLKDVGAIS